MGVDVLSIKLYLQRQIVGQICRLWIANPCPEEQREITCGIDKKGGGLVEMKLVCWGDGVCPTWHPRGIAVPECGGPSQGRPNETKVHSDT